MKTMGIKMKFLVFLAVMATSAHAQSDCASGFLDGSESFVSVSYKTTERRGETKTDVTEASVEWTPQEMLPDLKCFDLAQTALLFKTNNDARWRAVDAQMRSEGQV